MCKKQSFSFTQFYRSWNQFSQCRFTNRRYSRSHSLGPGDWNISFHTEQDWKTQGRAPGNPVAGYQAKPTNIDHIPSNTIHSGDGAMLYVFEDDEAVIKMMIKGRSPTMRHVSWTHRVALDWLFDRINLNPKIQIRYVDTKHQLADMLTKGNFTRDEWNHPLRLFYISHLASLAVPRISSSKIAPQWRRGFLIKKRRKGCVQVETSSDESFLLATSSSTASSPTASKSPGMPIASGKPDSRMSDEPSSFDAASTSQVRLKVSNLVGSMEEQRGNPSHRRRRRSRRLRQSCGWNLVLQRRTLLKTVKLGCNNLHTEPVLQLTSQKGTEATWDHYLQISPNTSHCMEAVLSMVRKIYGKQPGDPVNYFNMKLAFCGMFMNTTLRAAVHLGKDYDTNMRFVENYLWKTTGQLFRETKADQWSNRNHWHKHDQFPRS